MPEFSRRSFLKSSALFIGGAAATVVTGHGVRALFHSLSQWRKRKWLAAGDIASFHAGQPVKVEIKNADAGTKTSFSAWIVTPDGKNFTAFDPMCTHIECAYTWEEKKKQFFCPCHAGAFDVEGNVVSGPPPRALYRYPVKITGEKLYVMFDV